MNEKDKKIEEAEKIEKQLLKAKRIKKEFNRLRKVFKQLPEDKYKVAEGLIKNAAHLRIDLEDFENDLDTNGHIELFTQSAKTPAYERERPAARLYSTYIKNYQVIIKQLLDQLPKDIQKAIDDGFNDFANNR